jgi:hypothetical protein
MDDIQTRVFELLSDTADYDELLNTPGVTVLSSSDFFSSATTQAGIDRALYRTVTFIRRKPTAESRLFVAPIC